MSKEVIKPKTALDYDSGIDKLPKGVFKISPSSFSNFMGYPHQWYRQYILGEDGFMGNTSSVIGTIVHYVAECVGKGEEVDKAEIEQYIINQSTNPDVDVAEVRSQYKVMAEILVNTYLSTNMPTRVEEFIGTNLGNGVHVAGSVDAVNGDTLVDYKTYNSKTKPKSIPMNYKYQLLIYASIYRKLGIEINRIRLVYVNRNIVGDISEKTGKQLKSYPPEVTVLTEDITDEDIEFIDSLLQMCKESVLLDKTNPEYTHLVFKDMRLKR